MRYTILDEDAEGISHFQDADFLLLRGVNGLADAIAVAVPIQRRLIQDAGTEFNSFHVGKVL